jgi:hypothetical protein
MHKTWGRIRTGIWADQNGKSDLDRVINMTPIHSTDYGSIIIKILPNAGTDQSLFQWSNKSGFKRVSGTGSEFVYWL